MQNNTVGCRQNTAGTMTTWVTYCISLHITSSALTSSYRWIPTGQQLLAVARCRTPWRNMHLALLSPTLWQSYSRVPSKSDISLPGMQSSLQCIRSLPSMKKLTSAYHGSANAIDALSMVYRKSIAGHTTPHLKQAVFSIGFWMQPDRFRYQNISSIRARSAAAMFRSSFNWVRQSSQCSPHTRPNEHEALLLSTWLYQKQT